MQAFPFQSQMTSQKVKNILIRHSCSTKVKLESGYQHPEAFYMMKYSPKYYHNLTIEVTSQSPLLSKVKKIKKLRKFTGLFRSPLPQKLWFDLLANDRKEVEKMPEIICLSTERKLKRPFRDRLNLQKLKFFPKVRMLPKWKDRYEPIPFQNFNEYLSIKKSLAKYLCNMRSLKSLKMLIEDKRSEQFQWFTKKLNGMSKVLGRLETFALKIERTKINIQELLQNNKNLLSYFTCLNLSGNFNPVFVEIMQVCKNLESLSLVFDYGITQKAEFLNLLVSLQNLPKLVSLEISWPHEVRPFWEHFKPQSSLRYLKLKFAASDLVKEGLFGDDMTNLELTGRDVMAHWEEIKELDEIEFDVKCDKPEEILLVRSFITKVLKKVCRLNAMRFRFSSPLPDDGSLTHEPFLVEEVAHLYESLKKFEYSLMCWSRTGHIKFDLGIMKPFKNLKEVKLSGDRVSQQNIGSIVDLLQGNNYSELQIFTLAFYSSEWLKAMLRKIVKAKRRDNNNLKIRIEMSIGTGNFVDILQEFCEAIRSVQTIKGLQIDLILRDLGSSSSLPEESLRKVLREYSQIRNFTVVVFNFAESLQYVKIDGEKEQFSIHTH